MQVYFISGLGADNTVFQLLDLAFCKPVFIEWIKPKPKEPLPHYALRLKEAYAVPDDAVIAGLSFGGMLAAEIAKAFPATKVILLSSAKTKNEIPAFYKLGKYLPMYKWLPAIMQKTIMQALVYRFGVGSKTGRRIYSNVVKRADISFNNWAIWALLHWNNTIIPANITHIHGTADKILPYCKSANITIPNAGHLMVMENAPEVSVILKRLIAG